MSNNRFTVKQRAQVFRSEILIWIQWDPLSFPVQNTQFIECVLIRKFAQKVKYNSSKPKSLPFLSIFLIVVNEKKLKSLWGSGWVLQFSVPNLAGDLHGVLQGNRSMFEDNAWRHKCQMFPSRGVSLCSIGLFSSPPSWAFWWNMPIELKQGRNLYWVIDLFVNVIHLVF